MTPQPLPPPSYQKPWLSYQDQVALLQSRGMVIADLAAAAEFLRHVNYYRFSGYCLAFEQARHQFQPNVAFEQVQAAHAFDRVLRDVVTEALEIVEVDLRTAIAYHFGQRHGAFGHLSRVQFFQRFKHADWISKLHDEANRSSELFVMHFKATYREFPNLPVWVATEIMSFGGLSHMYTGMLRHDQKAISARYGLQPGDLASWMHHMVYVRNLCAHHSRLWDRVWAIKPTLPKAAVWQPPYLQGNNRLFTSLLMLNYLLRRCPPMTAFIADWRRRVQALIDGPPSVPNANDLMGMPANWKAHPLWT